jgi:hypothetical protein
MHGPTNVKFVNINYYYSFNIETYSEESLKLVRHLCSHKTNLSQIEIIVMQKITYVKIHTVINVLKYFQYYNFVPSVYFVRTYWSPELLWRHNSYILIFLFSSNVKF